MTTAVDTNVLVDVFTDDAPDHNRSEERLRTALEYGPVIACDIVYAELVPSFDDRSALDRALGAAGVRLSPIDSSIAYEAGLRWMRYRRAGGPRERIMADFLIGAHAIATAEMLLTRDRGFYATYFPELMQF